MRPRRARMSQNRLSFLEPACGDGNFLAEILGRKLSIVKERYRRSSYDWERNALLALGSLYGVDILSDNCEACRERLMKIWDKAYKSVCKRNVTMIHGGPHGTFCNRILSAGTPLPFAVLTFSSRIRRNPSFSLNGPFHKNNAFIHRKDYTFAELLDEKPKKASAAQQTLFDADAATDTDGEGKFIKEYVCHYRQLGAESDNEQLELTI